MASQYALGVDYGTNSVRALLVDLANGAEIAAEVWDYRHGDAGVIVDSSDPHLARQSPADYIEGFFASVRGALALAAATTPNFAPQQIVGVGVDTTGSTPLPVNAAGVP
ncbi:MAG TPA: ribulokinase, partial [Lacipirellulaceae bacterium]|nr:ribulokinase [Lacipirellulaceae bacterium]